MKIVSGNSNQNPKEKFATASFLIVIVSVVAIIKEMASTESMQKVNKKFSAKPEKHFLKN